jgi:hypothetical protein
MLTALKLQMDGWTVSQKEITVFSAMSGEREDVNDTTIKDWKSKLASLCEGFDSQDIFNMDKSGLFFKDTTHKTFHQKGLDCAGGKRSKERITIALCASMTGEKLKPLVIGKCRKPRCFKSIDLKNFSVFYHFNKKAWMTTSQAQFMKTG